MNWPNNGRIAVMMAFDLDGESLWEANHTPIDTLNAPRGSYGPIQGMPRILNLLDKHGIPATFFVPGITAERYPEVVREIGRCGHEIGYHGYIHETSSDRDTEHQDMLRAEQLMYALTGQRLVGHRGPDGGLFDYSLQLLLDHGYIYSSNYRNSDGPYLHRLDGREVPLVELPKDSIFDDTVYDMYADRDYQSAAFLRSARDFCQIWRDEFDALAEEGRMLNFVLHPQFIGRASRLNALSDLISYMKDNGAWFATNADTARHVLRQRGYEVAV